MPKIINDISNKNISMYFNGVFFDNNGYHISRKNKAIFKTRNSGNFIIRNIDHIDSQSVKYYTIEFIDTGFTTTATITEIRHGWISDLKRNSICGVACIGEKYKSFKKQYPELAHRFKNMHSHMIDRCYNQYSDAYKNYGAKGKHVCDRWLDLGQYCMDLIRLENFDYDEFIAGRLELDKDLKQKDTPDKKVIYSPKTCIWLPVSENRKYKSNTKW